MTLNLEKPGIIYNEKINESFEVAKKIASKFENAKLISIDEFDSDITFAICIGGDGSFLKCARFYSDFGIEIFGINLGRLGFLAQAKVDEIDYAISKIINDEVIVEKRLMLASLNGDLHCALNDIVIKGGEFSRTARLHLYINDQMVSDYLADGLIISTPTGSTAYTLSAGGPVVSPHLECFVIVAICPHSLTSRPLVIPSSEKITIKISDASSNFLLSADGGAPIKINNDVKIEKYKNYAKIVLLNRKNSNFYSVLRNKLHWGVAPKK